MKILDLIDFKLKKYKKPTDLQVVNAAKEIIQELALLGLARVGFFKKAVFHGGSAFRILYGLDRFSEDLDFCLQQPDKAYSLSQVLSALSEELLSWGLEIEVVDRSKAENAVKKAFLKESSLGAQLTLKHPLHREQKFVVKLEVDVNPPAGANLTSLLCEFPTDFYVTTHDQASMMAGKIHAILCRGYEKGRDWYDLMEYFSRKVQVNYTYLKSTLVQQGPFKAQVLHEAVDLEWLVTHLREKIGSVDVAGLKNDVLPFVEDESRIALWSSDFFRDKLVLWEENQRSVVAAS